MLSFCWSTDGFCFQRDFAAKHFSPDLCWKIEDTIFKMRNLYGMSFITLVETSTRYDLCVSVVGWWDWDYAGGL
ncbi:hypothetical protein HRI_002574000 [Hibiscus trionum]|uniref:Uncharacterized protein n=1 Tax=Hibiscus trionum TaxID=183268 RepID=A0A9W7I547_HIBTR|nr:hypothetical protein HRI_002574000 [Hibiscus trionum]